ncbi:MAG: hypothetical protein ACJAUD_000567 [Crocinitomicaceae bacterium]|jgi:hypothetical protein
MKTLLLLFVAVASFSVSAQATRYQYFDGADTSYLNAVIIDIDTTDSMNVWQIGPPQKIIFSTASTVPNVIVTDTINNYPTNDTSRFTAKVFNDWGNWGVFAFQWNQKIDFDSVWDGGLVETSMDNGVSWESAFSNPYVYNFYGYDLANVGAVGGALGQEGFVGTDTNWRNIWLCYDLSWLTQFPDTIYFRFSHFSDSISTGFAGEEHEGWMIDNMMAQETWVHTVKEIENSSYLTVGPNPSNDKIYIEATKIDDYHIIERMILRNAEGKVVKHFENVPTKFFIDVSDLPSGQYFLKVKTNIKTESFKVQVQN